MNVLIFTDPGMTGGSVVLDITSRKVLTSHPYKSDENRYINWFFDMMEEHNIVAVFVEEQRGFFADKERPAARIFVLAQNYGFHRGLVAGCDLDLKILPPKVWQNTLGVKGMLYEARKKRLAQLAKEKFPNNNVINTTSDAYLMADWWLRTNPVVAEDVGL